MCSLIVCSFHPLPDLFPNKQQIIPRMSTVRRAPCRSLLPSSKMRSVCGQRILLTKFFEHSMFDRDEINKTFKFVKLESIYCLYIGPPLHPSLDVSLNQPLRNRILHQA